MKVEIDYRTHPLRELPIGDKLRIAGPLLRLINDLGDWWQMTRLIEGLARDLGMNKWFLANHVPTFWEKEPGGSE